MKSAKDYRNLARRLKAVRLYFHSKEERATLAEVAEALTSIAQEADEVRALRERYGRFKGRSVIFIMCDVTRLGDGTKRTDISWDVLDDIHEPPLSHKKLMNIAHDFLRRFTESGEWQDVSTKGK